MSRIMAPLKTGNNVGAAGEPVNDFAFPFITPLRPNDDDISHDKLAK